MNMILMLSKSLLMVYSLATLIENIIVVFANISMILDINLLIKLQHMAAMMKNGITKFTTH